ncbi:DnaJ domain-containing protein [Aestuariivirga sp.]|uniref:J domain-containing protein n=1 Tax=Aestuariivirga sp. TaxID=2650926 RepID=UPI003594120B
MEEFPDHYTALGVDPTADQDVIAAAFRALAKKYHPDTGTAAGTASSERFAEVQEAYDVLGNPERRVQYDADLLEATQRALDAHLAAKTRRLAPGSVAQERLGRAGPDLGGIRPEPPVQAATSTTRRRAAWIFAGLLLVSASGAAALWGYSPPQPASEPAVAVQAPAVEATVPSKIVDVPQEPEFGSSATTEVSVDEPEMPASTPPAEPEIPTPTPKPAPAVQQKPKPVPADRGLFALVIYEKAGSRPVKSERASVLFNTRSNCAEFGVRTVLRRLAAEKGPAKPRIWYECRDDAGG